MMATAATVKVVESGTVGEDGGDVCVVSVVVAYIRLVITLGDPVR
jgi:hypothetical protein